MTREDIIRMARETGMISDSHAAGMISFLERFATLVAAANKPETAIAEAYRRGYEAGAIAARDSYIAFCEEHWRSNGNAMECSDAIRARGEISKEE